MLEFLDLGSRQYYFQHFEGIVLSSFKRITEVRLLFRLSLHVQQCVEARKKSIFRDSRGEGYSEGYSAPPPLHKMLRGSWYHQHRIRIKQKSNFAAVVFLTN